MTHLKSVTAAVLVAGFLGAAVNAVAQTTEPAAAPHQQQQGQQGSPESGKGNMQGMQGMQGMMGMMGMMNMMGQMDPAQMNRMMENCNKMMEGGMPPSQPSGGEPKKG